MRETTRYRATDWIDPRVEIRQSPIHGKGMFASAPIRQDEVVNIWGGTLLLTEEDIAGDQAKEWRAKGYVWAAIDEGEEDLTDFINHSCDPNVWTSHPTVSSLSLRRRAFCA